jgi:peptidoglycan/LPS O-acetylase OafA/YrhL
MIGASRPPQPKHTNLEARPAGPRLGRLTGVEGLRAVAASSIVVFHVWKYSSPSGREVDLGYLSRFALPHLPTGVTLFFTLSGYLLYRPIAASLLATGQVPGVRNYVRNRALRILPAYWVVLTAVAVILPAALLRTSSDPSSDLVLGRLTDHPGILLSNILFLQNYIPASLETGIGPAWSLAVEVVFYLSLPALAVLARYCYRRAGAWRGRYLALLAPAGALLVTGTAARAASVWLLPYGEGAAHDILVRSFLVNADLFAPGMALAVVHALVTAGRLRLPRRWAPVAATALIADVLVVVALYDRGALPTWGLANPYIRLTALACVLLVALVVLPEAANGQPSGLARLLEWRPLFLAGLASYSLFLWHEPITRLLTEQGLTLEGRSGFVANLGIIAAASGVLAAITYRFVERPALARKARSTASPRPAGATVDQTATENQRSREIAEPDAQTDAHPGGVPGAKEASQS